MKRIVLTCGIIAGLISCVWSLFGENFMTGSLSLQARIYFGYAAMVLAFSLIYVGVKNYRDRLNGGAISFGKALQISLLITLVASSIYTLGWLINYYFFIPDFAEKYMASMHTELVAKGASEAEIKKEMTQLSQYFEMYNNPLFNAATTFGEIFPVGVVISFITAFLLRKQRQVSTHA